MRVVGVDELARDAVRQREECVARHLLEGRRQKPQRLDRSNGRLRVRGFSCIAQLKPTEIHADRFVALSTTEFRFTGSRFSKMLRFHFRL